MHTLLFIVFSRSGGQGRAQGIVTMIIGKYLQFVYKNIAGLGAAGGGGAAVRQRGVPVPGHLPPALLHSRHRLRSG